MTTPKQVPTDSESQTFMEVPTIDQSSILDRRDPNISISSTTVTIPSGIEIHQDAGTSSVIVEPSSGEHRSTPLPSQINVGVPEDEQQPPTEDDPTSPLVPPRYRDIAPPIAVVDYRTYEPLPPPRPSLMQCMCCCFITTYNIHYARKIRNSKHMLFVLISLLVIPISALYFGIAYRGSCPMAEFSPVLLIILGIVGLIFIGIRLMTVASRRSLWTMPEPPRTISIALTCMLIAFMPMEMVNFYTKKPVFDNPKDHVFCEKPFYYYVFYMNFVVLIIGILALLLHIPTKPRDPVQVIPREHFDAL